MIAPAIVVLALLGAWELYVDPAARRRPPPRVAAPDRPGPVGRPLAAGLQLGTTAEEVVVGIVLSLALGLGLAVAIHFSPALRRALYPLMVGSQAVPLVIVAPLLVFWFGFGVLPKLAIIALICFFPVVVTTFDALSGVDPELGKLMCTLDAGRWQAFRLTELPAALPAAISGARIAVAVAVIGAVLAESSGSTSGLGRLIVNANGSLDTARGYAAASCSPPWPSRSSPRSA